MTYLYYGHFKKQTWPWGFSATESNYPSGWLGGLCVLEKTCCLSTTMHLPKKPYSLQSHKQAQNKFLFLWTCIPDLSLVGAPRASAYRPQGLTRWAEPILGIPWQFEKKETTWWKSSVRLYLQEGEDSICERKTIFWFSILRQYVPRAYSKLMVTHVVW